MNRNTRTLISDLERAAWFSEVGSPTDSARSNGVITISSWTEAIACCASLSWENYTLERSNSLTAYLHDHAPDRYRRWNEIVEEMKSAFLPVLDRKISPVVDRLSLPKVVVDCAGWDVLGACMESEFADLRSPGFYTDLIGWYLRGRFPCGWGELDEDGEVRLCDINAKPAHGQPDAVTRALNYPFMEPPISLPGGRLVIY